MSISIFPAQLNSYNMPISAKIIADSINSSGNRMTTFEIEYPRFILGELNTHRMLSKNSASSRAIPVKSMLEHINKSPAMPVHWGINKPGMQAGGSLEGESLQKAKSLWLEACHTATEYADQMQQLSLAKQVVNRVTEPWMMMKTVISGTEWANFFHLRDHPDAQPEFAELARAMSILYEIREPYPLSAGEWHLPYISIGRDQDGRLHYLQGTEELSLEDARVISASCCAQVSYRKNDDSLEKAQNIFDKLINSSPAHASPVEHQATPMMKCNSVPFRGDACQKGVSHADINGDLWSGNLKGWIQFRKLIPNEAVW